MKFRVKISPKVKKFLDKQSSDTISRIDKALSKLRENPFHNDELDIRKLIGFKNDYRLRIGQLRILYTVFKDESIIYVYKIAERGRAYKK